MIFFYLINDKVSLKQQLLVIYSVISALSCGITLAICYGLVYSLKNSAINEANNDLIKQTYSNARSLAAEIANTINQEIVTVGDSICLTTATFASILLSNANVSSLLKFEPSYNEYNFVGACKEPKCPRDYGLLAGRSRFSPNTIGFINGSLLHSSVYLYSSHLQHSIRDDKTWANITNQNPIVRKVINTLSYQDQDFNLMYTRGPNSTIMLTLSTQINLPSGDYFSAHRLFPGVVRNSSNYNPPIRPWFTNAIEDSYSLYGPYIGYFFKYPLITLSSRKVVQDPQSNQNVTIVAAADMAVSELSSLVNSVEYTYGGYGVLIARDTLEVLIWKNHSIPTVSKTSGKIKTVKYFDSELAKQPITQEGVFEYSDPQGKMWIVAAYPFFQSEHIIDPKFSKSKLVILVFAQRSLALSSLLSLSSNIDDTTNNIVLTTCIITAATVTATLLLVFFMVRYITQPLEEMLVMSEEIREISAEEDDVTDYNSVLNKAHGNSSRSDEIGILAKEYYNLVQLLNDRQRGQELRRNPFHIPPSSWSDPSELKWTQFADVFNDAFDDAEPVAALPLVQRYLSQEGIVNDCDLISFVLSPVGRGYSLIQQQELPESTMAQGDSVSGPSEVGWLTSLKSQLYFLSGILLAGVIVTMVVTAVSLSKQGEKWMSTSSKEINSNQVLNMQALTYSKSAFVKSYYEQLTMDLLTAGAFTSSLLSFDLTNKSWYQSGNRIRSYSCNVNDSIHRYTGIPTTAFSVYYSKDYASCDPVSSCDDLNNSTLTALTSLADLKLRSLLHKRSLISFIQFSLDEHAFTRFLPFPTDVSLDSAFDPRKSKWYQLGKASKSYDRVYFQNPSNIVELQNGFIPIQSKGNFSGAVSINYNNSQRFSRSMNVHSILSTGYYYVFETNSSALISHPQLSPSCYDMKCAEGLSDSDYREFRKNVQKTSYTYDKRGIPWHLTATPVVFGTIEYTVVATVPSSEVEKASADVTSSITVTITNIEITFAGCTFVCILALVLFSWLMIALIVSPINDLRELLALLKNHDSSFKNKIPSKASSRDMKSLLEAFSKLLVAVRFSNDWYSKGDHLRAQKMCVEALECFRLTGNKKGIGAWENNLSLACLATGDSESAEIHCNNAIKVAEEIVKQSFEQTRITPINSVYHAIANDSSADLMKAKRILSDRKGNLAVIYLQQNRFVDAFRLLEKLLLQDRNDDYTIGKVAKLGTLGHYYLKQGEIASAERTFLSALNYIRQQDVQQNDIEVTGNATLAEQTYENEKSEQIALFNLAVLEEAKKASEKAEESLLVALCKTRFMHTATATKILLSLQKRMLDANRKTDSALLSAIAKRRNFDIEAVTGTRNSATAKRVSFVIDYSASMSGPKIRFAIDNVQRIFMNKIYDNDSIMIITFNGSVDTVLPLTKKAGKESQIRDQISALLDPTGSTALYKALSRSISLLSDTDHTSNDWIIALTDGEDNSSQEITSDSVMNEFGRTDIGLIIIGVGADIQPDILKTLAETIPNFRGHYVFAEGDMDSISNAFSRAFSIIEGNLLYEDITFFVEIVSLRKSKYDGFTFCNATVGSSLVKNRNAEDARTDNYISKTIGKELLTALLSRANLKDTTSAKLQVKGPKQADSVQKREVGILRKQIDAFPEGLKENARVNYLLDQNNKRKDLQDFQCVMIEKFENILRSTLAEQNINHTNFRIGGYDKGPYEIFFRLQPQKYMTKALLVTALRLTFGNTMLKSNRMIDKLFDSFDFKRSDQMDWRSFLYLFTIMMQPYSSFKTHLRWGYALYSSLGSLDLDCTESATLGSLKDMITSPVVLALLVSVKTDFDAAWFGLSVNDPEAMKIAARSQSAVNNDSDLIKVPFHLFNKILTQEPFAKYMKCCTTFGKRDARQWTSHLEENFYHPTILKKLKELRRKIRSEQEADKFISLKSRRVKTNCMSIWKQFIKRRNVLRLVLIDFEMKSTLGNTGILFEIWKRRTIVLSSVQRIQRIIRGFLARRRRNFIRKLQVKALTVQSGARQLFVKLRYRKKYYKYFWAAATIQRHFRGRLARVRVKTIVEALYDIEKQKLVKERADWIAKRRWKAVIAIQMAARKMILRRRTMKKMLDKAKLEMTKRQMEKVYEEGMLERKVHRLKLTDWYTKRKKEHDQDMLEENQTSQQRKAVFARRAAMKREERAAQAKIREAQLERLEEEKVEQWLKNWEVTIQQRGIDRRKKLQNVISLPENQAELILKQQLLKRIKLQMKEVLRKADRLKIPMELPEAKEIATREIIEEEVKQELVRAKAEMKAESEAIQKANEEKAAAKHHQEIADKKRRKRWAAVTLQSYMRVFLARKELRRRAYIRYECHFDRTTHNYYYVDKPTQSTFWQKPKSLGSYDLPMRDSWLVMHDTVGDQYFYNVKSWRQSWDTPIGCVLCEKCRDDFAVAKLSNDKVCYCNNCLYDAAQQLLGMDYDSTQIKFKSFPGDENTAIVTDFRKIPEKTWYMQTLEIGLHMKLSPEEEEKAILAKAAKEKAKREKAERRRLKQEKKERKGKKKMKKSSSGNFCGICNNDTAEVQCYTCGKDYCQQCFVDAHYDLEESQSHQSSPIDLLALTANGEESSGLKLPAIGSARSGRREAASSDDESKKKKKKKKSGRKGTVEGSQSELEGGSISSKGKKKSKKTKKKKKSINGDSMTEDSDF